MNHFKLPAKRILSPFSGGANMGLKIQNSKDI